MNKEELRSIITDLFEKNKKLKGVNRELYMRVLSLQAEIDELAKDYEWPIDDIDNL